MAIGAGPDFGGNLTAGAICVDCGANKPTIAYQNPPRSGPPDITFGGNRGGANSGGSSSVDSHQDYANKHKHSSKWFAGGGGSGNGSDSSSGSTALRPIYVLANTPDSCPKCQGSKPCDTHLQSCPT